MRGVSRLAVGLLLPTTMVACVKYYPVESGSPAQGAVAQSGASADSAGSADAKEKDEDKSPFKLWVEVPKATEKVDGYFATHRKRDNTLFLEVPVDRLGHDFGMVLHYSRGAGDFDVQQGLPLTGAQLMRFQRVGDKVHLVHVNTRFVAEPGSAYEAGLSSNLGHSVVAAFDIKSEHQETKALLLDLTPFVVSDYARIANQLTVYYGQKPVSLAKDRSYVGRILGFPRNVEIDAELTFTSNSPPQLSPGYAVSDPGSVPIGVRYSIFALPDTPMTPRYADDRVGHFITARWDFSRDQSASPFLRYVNRWRLEKKVPSAEMSEPRDPIVYYVDPSVPEPYRKYVKQGIEAWNKAFEAAGYRQAIVAKDPPAGDSAWSAEDIRYSTVRWTPSYNMGYAIGPSQSDPRTGEILNADVLISSTFLRGWLTEYEEIVARDRVMELYTDGLKFREGMQPELAAYFCMAEAGKAHQAAFGRTALVALGEAESDGLPEEYVGDAIRDLIMHEVGHTLGLRHNFKGSTGIPYEKLNDTEFTRKNGLTLSVMEYAPINLAADRSKQGFYWNKEVGAYDEWAIRYAYSTILVPGEQVSDAGSSAGSPGTNSATPVMRPAVGAEEEVEGLREIASLAADPFHKYGTDEDTWLGAFSIDPHTNAWDLGSDPLAFARDRAAIVRRIQPRLEDRLVADGEGYQRLRAATTGLIFERYLSLAPIPKTVGGIEFSRDHKGDPNARPPFRPLGADVQREAVRFLMEQAFSEDSWEFDPELLNRLPPNRFSHWGAYNPLPLDFPVHTQVVLIQMALLGDLMATPRLWRLVDNEPRTPAGQEPYRVSELLETLTNAIWSELGEAGNSARPINSFRRNLQRQHLRHLEGLLLDSGIGGPVAAPEDARSLARLELKRLSERMAEALEPGQLDTMTEAHLAESKARIDRVLDASLVEGQLRLRR